MGELHHARNLYAVIPAGGSGTRLWPASRKGQPKFLLPLPGPRSMLQTTVDRLAPLMPYSNMYVVTGSAHAVAVARQLPELPEGNIVVEPAPRGTGPAIGLGAALIARRDPDAIMGSFAADHYVAEPERFRAAVRAAVRAAEQGYLVTIGIKPTYPETGYGYIRCGRPLLEHDGLVIHEVEEFKEKPDRQTAEAYLRSGRYFWNASMFIWRASTLLEAMRRLLPEVYQALEQIAAAWGEPGYEEKLAELWPQLPEVTIDHGIMERAERVAVVPADFGWTDLGDWHSLGELLGASDGATIAVGCPVIAEDTESTLVYGSGRTVVTLGVKNLVIVDTEDVVLVCDRSRAQDVRRIVRRLEEEGKLLLI
jgi:mannose-1-phosphate guanylyltransferase